MKTPLPSWSKLPLLVALLLFAPRVGLAAENARLARASTAFVVPRTDERASLRLLEQPTAEPQRERVPMGLRLLAELGAGLVTSSGGAFVGGLAGLGFCLATGSNNNYSGCLFGLTAGVILGGGLGYPLGVWWGGEAAGGDGSLLASFAGMGGVLLVGALLGLAMQQLDPYAGLAASSAAGVFSLAGPIVAYELSQRREPGPPAPAVASARPRLQPLLSVTPGGALLGLGGTF